MALNQHETVEMDVELTEFNIEFPANFECDNSFSVLRSALKQL